MKHEYFSIPRGYVPIRKAGVPSRYCIKVTFSGDICYFDRLIGRTVTEQEIKDNIQYLDEKNRNMLSEFFEKYPTEVDKKLYWCKKKQKCQRSFTRHYAIELKKQIEEERNANG
jgi:hypothetical protein